MRKYSDDEVRQAVKEHLARTPRASKARFEQHMHDVEELRAIVPKRGSEAHRHMHRALLDRPQLLHEWGRWAILAEHGLVGAVDLMATILADVHAAAIFNGGSYLDGNVVRIDRLLMTDADPERVLRVGVGGSQARWQRGDSRASHERFAASLEDAQFAAHIAGRWAKAWQPALDHLAKTFAGNPALGRTSDASLAPGAGAREAHVDRWVRGGRVELVRHLPDRGNVSCAEAAYAVVTLSTVRYAVGNWRSLARVASQRAGEDLALHETEVPGLTVGLIPRN